MWKTPAPLFNAYMPINTSGSEANLDVGRVEPQQAIQRCDRVGMPAPQHDDRLDRRVVILQAGRSEVWPGPTGGGEGAGKSGGRKVLEKTYGEGAGKCGGRNVLEETYLLMRESKQKIILPQSENVQFQAGADIDFAPKTRNILSMQATDDLRTW